MYLSIYLYLSLSISIYLYLSLSISIYLYLSLSISIYLCISLSFSLSLSISIYPISLSLDHSYIHIYIYLYLHGFGFSTNVAEMIGQACHNGFAAQPHGQTKEAVPTTEFGFGCHVGMVCHLQSGSWSYRVALLGSGFFGSMTNAPEDPASSNVIQHPASSSYLICILVHC